jgi:hypothetical protein
MLGFSARLCRNSTLTGSLVLLSLPIFSHAAAQELPREEETPADSSLIAGKRLRLLVARPSAPGSIFIGTVVAVTDSSIVLRLDRSREARAIPRDSVARLEVSRGRNVSGAVLRGALIGGGVGALVGAIAGEDCSQDDFICFDRAETIPLGALLFAGLGSVVGLLVGSREKWGKPVTFPRVGIAPASGGGVTMSASLSFR